LVVNQSVAVAYIVFTGINSIATVASPLRLTATPLVLVLVLVRVLVRVRVPPASGEHTGRVLAELGLDAAQPGATPDRRQAEFCAHRNFGVCQVCHVTVLVFYENKLNFD